MLNFIARETYYISSSAPKLTPHADLKRVKVTEINEKMQRWHFDVTGK